MRIRQVSNFAVDTTEQQRQQQQLIRCDYNQHPCLNCFQMLQKKNFEQQKANTCTCAVCQSIEFIPRQSSIHVSFFFSLFYSLLLVAVASSYFCVSIFIHEFRVPVKKGFYSFSSSEKKSKIEIFLASFHLACSLELRKNKVFFLSHLSQVVVVKSSVCISVDRTITIQQKFTIAVFCL